MWICRQSPQGETILECSRNCKGAGEKSNRANIVTVKEFRLSCKRNGETLEDCELGLT